MDFPSKMWGRIGVFKACSNDYSFAWYLQNNPQVAATKEVGFLSELSVMSSQ